MNVFTFWEGDMPGYIKLCMETWKVPYTILNYNNIREYADIDVEVLKRFSLPLAADIIRVHVLRDHGGYWLDADTIMVTGELPDANMLGDPETRTNSIALLHTEPHSQMFEKWAEYQDEKIRENGRRNGHHPWYLMGNSFTDWYVKRHPEIKIGEIKKRWPETYIAGGANRFEQYQEFYFGQERELKDIMPTDLLMLHNSWTPYWYKIMAAEEVVGVHCTLSNILREILHDR